MKSILEKNKEIALLMEFNPYRIKKSGVSISNFEKIIKKNNFKIYWIDERKKKVVPIGFEDLLEKYSPIKEYDKNGELNETNILCVKGSDLRFK